MVDLALKTLLHDKLRFAITVAGVAFAVMLVVIQVGMFFGILSNASVTIERLDADLWVTAHNTPNVDFAHLYPDNASDRVRSVPGVERADNLLVAFMTISLPTGAQETLLLYGLEDFRYWNFPWKIVEGDVDLLRGGPYMFLDHSAQRRFGPFAVGEYREIGGRRVKILGRTQEARSFTTTPIAFMNYRQAQAIGGPRLAGNTAYILVKLAKGASAEAAAAEIRKRLPYNDVYTRAEWAQRSKDYWIKSTGLGFNMYLTVFLGCLVGLVIVAQTLYASTMEHLKEFGTVKAIGGSNLDIYGILGRQAAIAAVAGFLLGLVPAFFVRPMLAKVDLQLLITPGFLAVVFAGTVVMCLGAAMISFKKVAGIDPGLVFRG